MTRLPSAGAPKPEAGFVTFHTLVLDRPEHVPDVVDLVTGEVSERLRHSRGFRSSRIHVSADGRTVITRTLWQGAADHRAAQPPDGAAGGPPSPAGHPAVRTATVFLGRPSPGITGPALGQPPGVVAVATRHLRDPACFPLLMDLLVNGGDWKRHHRGFISATPNLGTDGTTFVNYPMWSDEESYQAWMADPRLSHGQQEIARLEAAPPEYVLCTVTDQIGPPGPR